MMTTKKNNVNKGEVIKKLGIYVHIPFCEKKCDYCNFISFCKSDVHKAHYVNALLKEIELQAKEYKSYVIDTIFVGGGTPTCLLDGQILKIIKQIKAHFVVCKNAEITIECNPNTLTETKLEEFKEAGVNRLSIGLQTYSNKLLKLIGRLHTKKQFDNAIKLAKQKGFENINVDLILGIPTQNMNNLKHELKHLLKLKINHISAYGLIVEENTKLAQNLKNNVYKLPSENLQVKMYDYTKKYLYKYGLKMYEVSNFAKHGYESKHNLKYWTNGEYLGLGLNSSSYVNLTRWKNTDNLEEYIKSIKNNIIIKNELEIIDISSQIEECIMLSLRTSVGIDLNDFKNRFGFNLLEKKSDDIEALKNSNLIAVNSNYLYCTDLGFKLLNQVILALLD